jgi:hypothetical protein
MNAPMLISTAVKQGMVKMDRWSFWPGFAALMTVAVLDLLCKLPGPVGFLLRPISSLCYLIISIVILVVVVIFVVKKSPRRAASLLLVLVTPVLLWSPINWVTDCVHLGLTVGFGGGQLGSSLKPNGSGFAAYDWSVGFAGTNTFIIYDMTDQIALPIAQHTHPSISENEFEEECAGQVRHLLGHYYVCAF